MITPEELTRFMNETFSNVNYRVEAVGDGRCSLIQDVGKEQLRPGGTVSGPTLMGLADAAMYGAIIGSLGLNDTAIMSVTTSLNINFLRKPKAENGVMGVCELIKVGKKLIVGEVSLYSVGDKDKPVAHVVATYSVPG